MNKNIREVSATKKMKTKIATAKNRPLEQDKMF